MTREQLIELRNGLYEYNASRDLRWSFTTGAEKRGSNLWHQLYHCQAWYKIDPSDLNLVWLKSYNTIVAVFVVDEQTLYSYGRFSMTTYQHVRKFRNRMWELYHKTTHVWDVKEVNLEVEQWFFH